MLPITSVPGPTGTEVIHMLLKYGCRSRPGSHVKSPFAGPVLVPITVLVRVQQEPGDTLKLVDLRST